MDPDLSDPLLAIPALSLFRVSFHNTPDTQTDPAEVIQVSLTSSGTIQANQPDKNEASFPSLRNPSSPLLPINYPSLTTCKTSRSTFIIKL